MMYLFDRNHLAETLSVSRRLKRNTRAVREYSENEVTIDRADIPGYYGAGLVTRKAADEMVRKVTDDAAKKLQEAQEAVRKAEGALLDAQQNRRKAREEAFDTGTPVTMDELLQMADEQAG